MNRAQPISREELINKRLECIAYEERALGRIIDMQGNEISLLLNSLTHEQSTHVSQDLIAVNKSVDSILKKIVDSQIIIKNETELLLYGDKIPAPVKPLHKEKKAVAYLQTSIPCLWEKNIGLSFETCNSTTKAITWNLATPQSIYLEPKKRFLVNFQINASMCRGFHPCISIMLQLQHDEQCKNLYHYVRCLNSLEYPMLNNISCAGLFISTEEMEKTTMLCLNVLTPFMLCVRQAHINILEI